MLNLVISEDLIDWASSAAERRGMSVSALVREALERERERSREEALAEAAESLADMYRTEDGLASLRVLDGEDFA